MKQSEYTFNINNDDFEKSFKQEFEKFEQLKQKKVIISLFGDVNVGKSETMNALTGRKLSKVSAVAGETTELAPYPYSENVIIVDTPGLNDINESVSKKACDFVEKESDIIILFFNAAVGASGPIIDTYKNLKKLNKPIIIVLNKIDIWYDDGVFDYISQQQVTEQIEKETEHDVINISAKKRINIDKLNDKIMQILNADGKGVLFSKVSVYKEDEVKKWINAAAVTAFGIGIIPLPVADVAPLTALQVALALKIAYVYNCKIDKDDVMKLIGSTVTGSVGKQIFKLAVQGLKAMGWLGGPALEGVIVAVAGTIAASITYAFGVVCEMYYKNGMKIELGVLSDLYKESYWNYYKRKNKSEDEVAATEN